MHKSHVSNQWIVWSVIAIITLAYGFGISKVPFHPDESTQIYMSGDLELFFNDPTALFWNSDRPADIRQNYRLLDAPLTRDLIGAGRWISGHLPATPTDWNWSLSWDENQAAGALPNHRLLLVARLSVAFLFPFTLYFTYDTARRLAGSLAGWIALLLMAGNALVLLHTRRAMAESVLLFTIVFFSWGLTSRERYQFWLAIPAALAFCAKQSAGVLFIPGLLAVLWPSSRSSAKWDGWKNAILYTALFCGVILLLHPVFWSDPYHAVLAAVDARQDLVSRQIDTLAASDPNLALTAMVPRFANTIYQVFLAPVSIADVGNYKDQILPSATAYRSNPIHSLLRGLIPGALMFIVVIFGIIVAIFNSFKNNTGKRREVVLLLLTGLIELAAILAFIPIPFQRYIVPLIPGAVLWAAYGITQMVSEIKKGTSQKSPSGEVPHHLNDGSPSKQQSN
jgi:hypothetical protein